MRPPQKFGKYLLLDRIAIGGMAEVYVGKAFGVEGFERLLALKKILPTLGEDPEFASMFVDEARLAVQLSHANVVQVHELGRHEGTLYIAMEYISGIDLRAVSEGMRRKGVPVPIAPACFVGASVCAALDYAHHKLDAAGRPLGIVHRDVSPQNILVSFDGGVKLIDFGIAKAERRLQRTESGVLKGKLGYLSPEQVRGEAVDGRTDIFALAIVLWELVTGHRLFAGESDFAVLDKIRSGAIASARAVNPAVPEGLERVLRRALATDPRKRFTRAAELQQALLPFTVVGGDVFGARELADFLRVELQAEHAKEEARMRGWLQLPVDSGPLSTPTAAFRLPVDADTLVQPPAADEPPPPPPAVDVHDLPTMELEVTALQEAGRERARPAWWARWIPWRAPPGSR